MHAWLQELPKESVVIGATARAPIPFELLGLDHRRARPAGPMRPFGTFALVTGRPEVASREDDTASVLEVDAGLLKLPVVRLPGRARCFRR